MRYSRRALWLYPLFQIPSICLLLSLIAALLAAFLGLGRPQVAVAIALDLSNSTYPSGVFNAPGSIMAKEVAAVSAYLDRNTQDILQHPNQVRVFGFGGVVQPLTQDFDDNSPQVKGEMQAALKDPSLPDRIVAGRTDLDAAIAASTNALRQLDRHCKELLLVTDGQGNVSPQTIAEAALLRVKINAIVIGSQAPALAAAAAATRGIYLSSVATGDLEMLFSESLFTRFNSNLRWILFWSGCAWISLMWLLVLPLDRWVFQNLFKLHWSPAGKIALCNALFWTAATPVIVWFLAGGIPFLSQC